MLIQNQLPGSWFWNDSDPLQPRASTELERGNWASLVATEGPGPTHRPVLQQNQVGGKPVLVAGGRTGAIRGQGPCSPMLSQS